MMQMTGLLIPWTRKVFQWRRQVGSLRNGMLAPPAVIFLILQLVISSLILSFLLLKNGTDVTYIPKVGKKNK